MRIGPIFLQFRWVLLLKPEIGLDGIVGVEVALDVFALTITLKIIVHLLEDILLQHCFRRADVIGVLPILILIKVSKLRKTFARVRVLVLKLVVKLFVKSNVDLIVDLEHIYV